METITIGIVEAAMKFRIIVHLEKPSESLIYDRTSFYTDVKVGDKIKITTIKSPNICFTTIEKL